MSSYIEGALIIGIKATEFAADMSEFQDKFEILYNEVEKDTDTEVSIGVFGAEFEDDFETFYIGFKVAEDGEIDMDTLSKNIEITTEIALNYLKRPKLINTFYRY